MSRRGEPIGRTRRMVLIAMLLALGVGLHALEALIPAPIALPGAKLGIANIVTLVCLYALGPVNAILLAVARVTLGGLVSGTFGSTAFFMAMAGAVGSGLAMSSFRALTARQAKLIAAASMVGAVAHNISQLAMFTAIAGTSKVFVMLPYLLAVALPTGYFTGLAGVYAFMALSKLRGFSLNTGGLSSSYGKRSLIGTAAVMIILAAVAWGAILLSDRIAQARVGSDAAMAITIKRFEKGAERGQVAASYPWPPQIGQLPEGQFELEGRIGISILEYDEDKGVRFISSPCPDKLCVKHGWVNDEMDLAACLPNGLVVTVEDRK